MFIFLVDFPFKKTRIQASYCTLECIRISLSVKQLMTKQFIVQDPYFDKAKKLGYRARSAFKLIEIQEKYNIIHPKMNVLDVGAAPGSFLQVIGKIVDLEHKVVGIDITKINPNFGRPNIHLLQESIFEYDKIRTYLDSLNIGQFDLITSDIAPSTT